MKLHTRKSSHNKTNKTMQEKVNAAQFFLTQIQILKDLCHEYPFQTIAIIVISCVTSTGTTFAELRFLEYASNSAAGFASGSSGDNVSSIVMTFAGFLLILLALRILSAVYRRISEKYESNLVYRAEKKITRRLADIPYELYESKPFYDKINLARQVSGQYSNAVYGITTIFNIATMLIVYIVLLSRLNLIFLVGVLFSILVSIFLSAFVTDKQLDYWRVHVSPASRINGYFMRIFNSRINHQNIQMTRSLSYFLDRYSRANRRECVNYLKLNLLSFTTEFAAMLFFVAAFIATALYTGSGVARGRYEIGYFTMILSLLFQLFQYLKSFSMFLNQQNWYIKVLNAYYEILKSTDAGSILSETRASHGMSAETGSSDGIYQEYKSVCRIPKGENSDSILLRNIAYQYPQSSLQALSDVTARFKAGEKIAVVGVNGSGKTTLISIILSLLNPQKGEYLGREISKTAILQDFCQYQMTIRQNIEIGCGGRKLPEEKIWNILRQVGLKEEVAQLPAGINTMLGQLEEGIELSKGQWQRLVIGRLLAEENAKIWILDEPTAYLDPIAEVEMYRQIWRLSGNRLVFFISHRLGFAQNADRIIVVEKGRIAESDSHGQLMENEGIYAAMFRGQQEWYA